MPEVNNEISKSLIETLIKTSFFSKAPGPGIPLKVLKVGPQDPLQNLKLGPQDPLQSLKVGPLSLFFNEFIFCRIFHRSFYLFIFVSFLNKIQKNINCE